MGRAAAQLSLRLASLSVIIFLAAPVSAADLPEDWLENQHRVEELKAEELDQNRIREIERLRDGSSFGPADAPSDVKRKPRPLPRPGPPGTIDGGPR